MSVDKYKHKDFGTHMEAVRYGNENGSWDQACVSRIARFVLGVDVDSRLTSDNERMLDVVRPVNERWDPTKLVADIHVADWPNGRTYTMSIGDWLVKDSNGTLFHYKPSEFRETFEKLLPKKTTYSEWNELSDLVYNNFPWEGETYQAVAEKVATQIVNAGWAKK